MIRRHLSIALATALIGFCASQATVAGEAHEHPAPVAHAGLDRLKTLAGEWVGAEGEGKGQLQARYAVTSGGSAVVETLFPGTPSEMVTVYHLDGKDVVLTHYCALGNQPHMRGGKLDGGRMAFAFDGGSNFNAAKDQHMHQMAFEFVSADEIKAEWISMKDNKLENPSKFHMIRKGS